MAGGVLTWAGGGLREPTASLEQGRGEGGPQEKVGSGRGKVHCWDPSEEWRSWAGQSS